MTQIQIDWSRTEETKRHNLATEGQAKKELAEINRHNVVTEVETNRHNVAYEKETKRHNKAGESETHRHNVKTESLEGKKLKETVRHDKKTESLEAKKVKETKRHNKKTERQQDTHLHNETRQTEANIQKTKADIKRTEAETAYTQAKTELQKFTNSIDMSDPTLFKTNRFINVFKKGSEAAWVYYGLDLASKKQKQALNTAATSGTNAQRAVDIIDSLNFQKNGSHLSSKEKNSWLRIFSAGKQGSKTHGKHGGTGGKF